MPLVLPQNTAEKRLSPDPCYVFIHIYTTPLEPFFFFPPPEWISLSSEVRCTTLFIIFVLLCWICSSMFMSLLYWAAQKWIQHSKCASSGLNREEGSLPLTCWHCSLLQARTFLNFAVKALCWLMINLMPDRSHRVFSPKLLSSQLVSSVRCWIESFLPGAGLGISICCTS